MKFPLIAIAILSTALSLSQDSQPLKGIKSALVIVGKGEFCPASLDDRRLQTSVELRMRQSGITVKKGADGIFELTVNCIGIRIGNNVLIGHGVSYAAKFSTYLIYPENGQLVEALLWEGSDRIGSISNSEDFYDKASGNALRQVEDFLNKYLEANPKK